MKDKSYNFAIRLASEQKEFVLSKKTLQYETSIRMRLAQQKIILDSLLANCNEIKTLLTKITKTAGENKKQI